MKANSRIPRAIFTAALFAALLANGSALPAQGTQKSPVEHWHVNVLKGERIGFGSHRRETSEEAGNPVLKTESLDQFKLIRDRKPLLVRTIVRTVETPDGELIRFDREFSNPPAEPMLSSGKVTKTNRSDPVLELSTTINGLAQTKSIPWKPGVKSPVWIDRVFEISPIKPGEKRQFDLFLPELDQITTASFVAKDWEPLPPLKRLGLASAPTEKSLRVDLRYSFSPELPVTAWLDSQGHVAVLAMQNLGSEMLTVRVSKEDALKEISGGDLDLNVATSIVVANPPTKPHQQKSLCYKVTARNGDPAKFFPASNSQKVERIDDATIRICVTAIPIPDAKNSVSPGVEFQEPSAYLQTDDAGVIRHAVQAVGEERNAGQRAKLMEAYVRKNVRQKAFSTALASAAEVARTLEGDCTESAVLLAAMLRVKGIPSRLAVGLVFVESTKTFGCHMWTEAWLADRWVPLDATIGQGGIGAGHLKMLDASFHDSGPTPVATFIPLLTALGQLSIQMSEGK